MWYSAKNDDKLKNHNVSELTVKGSPRQVGAIFNGSGLLYQGTIDRLFC